MFDQTAIPPRVSPRKFALLLPAPRDICVQFRSASAAPSATCNADPAPPAEPTATLPIRTTTTTATAPSDGVVLRIRVE